MDTVNTPTYRKKLRRLSAQDPCESRKRWKDVTTALRRRDVEKATDAKHAVSHTHHSSLGPGQKWASGHVANSGPSPLIQNLSNYRGKLVRIRIIGRIHLHYLNRLLKTIS